MATGQLRDDVAVSSPDLSLLPTEALVPHASNPRGQLTDLDDLARSIGARGVLHPLVVVPTTTDDPNDGARWLIIAGHRRRAAAMLAGVELVPCIVRHDLDDPADQLAAMIIENTERRDLTVAEEIGAVQGLLDLGDSVRTAARRVGMSERRMRDRAKVAKSGLLPMVAEHDLTLDDALMMATHPDDRNFLEGYLGTGSWAWAKQRVKDFDAERKTRAELASAAADLGITVVVGRAGHDLMLIQEAVGDPDLTHARISKAHPLAYALSLRDAIKALPKLVEDGDDPAALMCLLTDGLGSSLPAKIWRINPESPATSDDQPAADGVGSTDSDEAPADDRSSAHDEISARLDGEAQEREREHARRRENADRRRADLAAAAAVRAQVVSEAIEKANRGQMTEDTRAAARMMIAETARAIDSDTLLLGRASELLTGEINADLASAADAVADALLRTASADATLLAVAALNGSMVDLPASYGTAFYQELRPALEAWLDLLGSLGWTACDIEQEGITDAQRSWAADDEDNETVGEQ